MTVAASPDMQDNMATFAGWMSGPLAAPALADSDKCQCLLLLFESYYHKYTYIMNICMHIFTRFTLHDKSQEDRDNSASSKPSAMLLCPAAVYMPYHGSTEFRVLFGADVTVIDNKKHVTLQTV